MVLERVQDKEQKKRFKLLIAFGSLLMGIIFLRLFYIQLISYWKFKNLAESNSTRVVPKRAARGIIYDRYGEKLADSVPSYTVSIIPIDLKDREKVVPMLAEILEIPEEEINQKIENQKQKVFEAIKIKGNLKASVISIIEEHKPELSGVIIHTEAKRNYPNKEMASHVVGYVGEVNPNDVSKGKLSGGDIVGRSGIERRYDSELRGINGASKIMVNSSGKEIKSMGDDPFIKGTDLVLTIDLKLQEACEESFRGRRGVIVCMNPVNGEIYALVSKPSFDPNIFCGQLDKKEWKKMLNDPEQPFLNRAVGGLYSPGSVFKIVPAVTALEKNKLTVNDVFVCRGTYHYGKDWTYDCWKSEGHGVISMVDAIAQSCDIYFYQLGLTVTADRISEYARLFGYGDLTGIDLDGEKSGLVPTPSWKKDKYGIHWFPGNTIQYTIGQGYITANPLQILSTYNIIINNGTSYKPHLVKAVGGKEIEKGMLKSFAISAKTLEVIKKSLWKAVNLGGTGGRSKSAFGIAGKTATVENPHGLSHAAFVGYAPFANPEVSVLVFIEAGGSGGENAAPIGKQVIESYFKLKKERYAAARKTEPKELK
ncbi:MAG: penicillin-binding protein 2 [Candidatus Firestonebacteria bacterium]